MQDHHQTLFLLWNKWYYFIIESFFPKHEVNSVAKNHYRNIQYFYPLCNVLKTYRDGRVLLNLIAYCLLNSEKKKLEVALYHNNFYIVKPLGNKPGKYKTSGLLISYYQILCMHIWRICHWFLTKTSNLCHTFGNFDTRNRDCSYTFFQLLFC